MARPVAAQPAKPNATSKISAYLSRLSPVPSFSDYTGPHKVGTVDVEIPVSELEAPCDTPKGADNIHTVLFRIYYPTTPDATGKRITWLPAPQRQHLSAYGQFLGIGPRLSSFVSFLPRHLYHTSIPVLKNAALLEPPAETHGGRWPTMIFSHGLGGSRNAYSHIAGSLASHGMVVICPEHRDGSAVSTMVRDPAATPHNSFFAQGPRSAEVLYQRIAHTTEPATWEARDAQLSIRAWELGLALDAIFTIDEDPSNSLTNLNSSTPPNALAQFARKLHVQEPGSIAWGGHSFGAATTVQLLKSTYYADTAEVKSLEAPIFVPRSSSRLRSQITERSVAVLLDMWCFPLVSPRQAALFQLPLPCYADTPSAPGGEALLAIESDTFFNWTEHLHTKALALSAEPGASVVSAASFERPATGRRLAEPHFFRVRDSAHLSQSDFGILFPWLTRRVFKAQAPERALRLNVRAILQLLRGNGLKVARTCAADLVDSCPADAAGHGDGNNGNANVGASKFVGEEGLDDDPAILDRSVAEAGGIDAWLWVDIVGLGPKSNLAEKRRLEEDEAATDLENEDGEVDMQGEIEPHLTQNSSGPQAAVAAPRQ